jgi:aminomethyltransferase
MTDFSGYSLPLSYAGGGFIAEHIHTRTQASLFDASHMGQLTVSGSNAAETLSKLTPADVSHIAVGTTKYAVLTSDCGGVLDDFIIGNDGDRGFFIVFNASRKAVDIAHLRKHLPASCTITEMSTWALLALQGPQAAAVMETISATAVTLNFMHAGWFNIDGVECRITRGGYTGEDGFEISIPAKAAVNIASQLAAHPAVKPAGLGARDSLRLEAGLCLYGHELTENITPIEAGLLWSIPKHRREGGDYAGADIITQQIANGPSRSLVGLRPQGKKVVRAGAKLRSTTGEDIGAVTSGLHGPSLQFAIALGFVKTPYAATGGIITAEVRGEWINCEVVKLPFVSHQYRRKS